MFGSAVSVGKNREGKGSRPGKQVGNRIRKAGGRKIDDDTEHDVNSIYNTDGFVSRASDQCSDQP